VRTVAEAEVAVAEAEAAVGGAWSSPIMTISDRAAVSNRDNARLLRELVITPGY
jgi:hypothetical protein